MKNKNNVTTGTYSDDNLPYRFDVFIRTGIINLVRDEVRRIRRQRVLFVDDCNLDDLIDDHAEEAFDEAETEKVIVGKTKMSVSYDDLARCMESLSERDKLIIEGTLILEFPQKDVGESLNIPSKSVAVYKLRAIERLRKMLGGDIDEKDVT